MLSRRLCLPYTPHRKGKEKRIRSPGGSPPLKHLCAAYSSNMDIENPPGDPPGGVEGQNVGDIPPQKFFGETTPPEAPPVPPQGIARVKFFRGIPPKMSFMGAPPLTPQVFSLPPRSANRRLEALKRRTPRKKH